MHISLQGISIDNVGDDESHPFLAKKIPRYPAPDGHPGRPANSPTIRPLVPTCESSRNPLPGGRGSEVVAEPRAQASGRASRTVANFCKLVLAL